jgi:hypothetical protein
MQFTATGQIKYSLDNHGIDLTIDNTWEYQKGSDDTYAFTYKCENNPVLCKNIVIKVIINSDHESIDKLTQSIVSDYIPSKFKQNEIVSVRSLDLHERQFKVIDYRFKDNGVDLSGTILITERKDEFIAIYFTALNQPVKNYSNERKLLFEILKSLEITNR